MRLNPLERQAFKSMLALRRVFPERAETLRRCVVEGVRALPIQREVTLLTLIIIPVLYSLMFRATRR